MGLNNGIFASLFPSIAPREDISRFVNAPQLDSTIMPQGGGRVIDDTVDTPQGDVSVAETLAPAPAYQPTNLPQATGTPHDVPVVNPVTFPKPSNVMTREGFTLPYENPKSRFEQAQNALAMGEYDVQHPQNQDHGAKGFFKELLANLHEGARYIRPGAGLGESLAIAGAAAGGGLINRSANEKREAERNLPMLQQNAKLAGDAEDAMVKREATASLIKDRDTDNERARDDFNRKVKKDDRDYEIKGLTLDFRKEDRDRYYELEDIKNKAREKHDEKMFKLADDKQQEIVRHNKTTEGQAVTNETGRNNRAGAAQAGQTARSNNVIAAKTDAQRRATLAAIEASSATPEQKAAAKAALLQQ